MKQILKDYLFVIGIVSIVPLIFLCLVIYAVFKPIEIYETNSVADYGNIVGNCDNETPEEFIFSFFPTTILDSFSDVDYHYKAKKLDTYAYEAYLEFVIEDEAVFSEFIKPYVDDSASFAYDESFMEKSIIHHLCLDHNVETEANIADAEIGKILYSEEEQRIIFFALGLHDGGGTYISELSYFVDRFGIDWKDLEAESEPYPTISLSLN